MPSFKFSLRGFYCHILILEESTFATISRFINIVSRISLGFHVKELMSLMHSLNEDMEGEEEE